MHRFQRRHLRLARGAALALVLALPACSERAAKASDSPTKGRALAPPENRRLTARLLDESEDLGRPGDLAVVGGSLVLINSAADSAIRVYDAASGRLVRTFGRSGAGPREFRAPWSLDPVAGSRSAFWVFDIGLNRMTYIDLEADFQPGKRYGDRIVQMTASGPLNNPVWINDSLLVSSGYFAEAGRLGQLDGTGKLLRVVGDPPPGNPETPMPVRQHAYQTTVRPNPERSLLALGTRHADRFEILDTGGRLVAAAKRPVNFEPVYKTAIRAGYPAMESGDEMRFGYIDLTTTSSRVYALYSGRRRADFPGAANFGEYVHVYDWNAKLLEVIRLDGPVFSIAADEATQTLYAVRERPEPVLLAYDLRAGGAR